MAEKSLKARALELLSRREYSRRELASKLQAHAQSPDEVDAILAELAEHHWQSDARFAGQFAHSKGQRWGSRRLKDALRNKGVDDDTISAALSTHDDLAVARHAWQKKFGTPPATAQERARQMRFLASRGFPMDVIRRVITGCDDDFAA